MNTAEMLIELGHEVFEAATAGAAMAAIDAQDFEVLVTDLGLPDMSGSELARKIRARKAGIGVVYATGDSHPPSGAVERAVLLGKPYDVTRLVAAIAAARQTD